MSDTKPNILFVMADQLAAQFLPFHGHKLVKTPNLSRLAAEGVRYTRFYSGHVCSPSRSAFMTGMYATTIGSHQHRTVNKQPLPEGVRAGYADTAQGLHMHYLEAGYAGDGTDKPLLLLMHGFPELAYSWRHQLPVLAAAGYHVIAPDQRGYGRTHPFAGEIRLGTVEVSFTPEELGFPVVIGEITVTECEMINQFKGSATVKPQFTRGYGLGFGQCERKVMSMALVDRSLRAGELGEERMAPAQDEEFVLSHSDNVQATGFVEHLKLPHYVDFQSELVLLRRLRAEIDGAKDRLEAAE